MDTASRDKQWRIVHRILLNSVLGGNVSTSPLASTAPVGRCPMSSCPLAEQKGLELGSDGSWEERPSLLSWRRCPGPLGTRGCPRLLFKPQRARNVSCPSSHVLTFPPVSLLPVGRETKYKPRRGQSLSSGRCDEVKPMAFRCLTRSLLSASKNNAYRALPGSSKHKRCLRETTVWLMQSDLANNLNIPRRK